MTAGRSRYLATVLLVAALLLCTTGLSAGAPGADNPLPRKPLHEDTNVILISLQCLRADHLGAYGYKRNTSPNIDRLASQSVLFQNAISQSNLTPVAQMSVLTSQYPRVNGMVSFEVSKDTVTSRTLPEILKYYGYATAAAVSSPEFFMRFDAESGAMVNPGDLFSRSFDYYGRTIRARGPSIRKPPAEALEWLQTNKDKKFFLWIASGLLHMPYAAAVPPQYKEMFTPPDYVPFWIRFPVRTGGAVSVRDPDYEVFSRVFHNRYHVGFSPVYQLTAEDVGYVNGRYDAGVYYTDLFVGELLKLLDSLNLTEKTLIVLQSIHGDDLGEQGNFFHYDLSDAVLRNALVMRFPHSEYAGRRVVEQVQGVDIMPTILDYLGIPLPHDAEGASTLPLIRGDKGGWQREFAYIDRVPWWEYTLSRWYLDLQDAQGVQYAPSEEKRLREYATLLKSSFEKLDYPPGDIAIRSNEWKLVIRKNVDLLRKVSWWSFITGKEQPIEEMELYDLRIDPSEKRNVARDHPGVVAMLRGRLLEWDASVERQKSRYPKEKSRLIIPYP